VAGLYAAGAVTAGLHGANRLGGNSLAETVGIGRRAGQASADDSTARDARLRARKVVGAADDELSSSIRSAQVWVLRPTSYVLRLEP
jgi:succinate dehydrogenase / fumarate reductase flavoprotein subunit